MRKLLSKPPRSGEGGAGWSERRTSIGKSGGCREPAQELRIGSLPSWTEVSQGWDRIRVEEMPSYLLVLLRNRKHPRAATSTTPTRTPITMPITFC